MMAAATSSKGGGAERQRGEPSVAATAARAARRPLLRRWLMAAMLLVASLLAVLYISNAIAINDLLVDITSLNAERDVVLRENERLRGELLRLMSVERVTTIARERLGMVQPRRPPQPLQGGGVGTVPERNEVQRDTAASDNIDTSSR